MFDKLQELDLPNIVKLYNYYYLEVSKLNRFLHMEAYTMEQIEKDDTILLEQNKEYLLNALYSLEETCLYLARNKIEINDAHSSNVIFNKQGATLIDVDTYCIRKMKNVDKVFLHNKAQILYILGNQVKKELQNNNYGIDYYKVMYLFNIDIMRKSLAQAVDEKFKEETLLESLKRNI